MRKKTIYEVVTPEAIALQWNEGREQRDPFELEAFFTPRKQMSTLLSVLEGYAPKVKALNLSSYDAKVMPVSFEAFSKITTEIPFFKNSANINEELRRELINALSSTNSALLEEVLVRVLNYPQFLLERARTTKEIIRAQVLTTGMIAMSNNGQAIGYDFEVPNTNKFTPAPGTEWKTHAISTPIEDLDSWMSTVAEESGERPKYVVMNTTTFNDLKKSASVKGYFGDEFVSTRKVRALVADELDVTLMIYDKTYTEADATGNDVSVKFIPDGVVSLLPARPVGLDVNAVTPEEADLIYSDVADVTVVDNGIAITRTKEPDPVTLSTKVSMNFISVLTTPNAIGICSVYA